VAVVVADHQAADAQRLRDGGSGRKRGQRSQLVAERLLDEVIAH